ncbi:uncharacterized protein J3D65DRAFT_670793 [Phyllosticta citribraziliensis]|uniref:Anaphase-promoting complex subunit 4 n=1 Tax=Phyllosticta citribraziliensis TaxID=989973 RepID=A0ABR1LA89_9PEZI
MSSLLPRQIPFLVNPSSPQLFFDSMAGATILLSHLLPAEAVELGRLVIHLEYPEQEFFQSEDASLSPAGILTQRLDNFQQTLEQSTHSGVESYLSNLLSGARNKQRASRINLSSAACITRQLQNSSQYLERLCATRLGQFWLERAIRTSQDVFLVTGIKTVFDASVENEASHSSGLEAKVQAPLTMAATATGVPVPIDGMLDIGARANRSKMQSNSTSFTAPGEQIFAVQYRKLRFARFSTRKVENARLEGGNRWKMYLGGRGDEDEDSEEIVSVEVDAGLEDGFDSTLYESGTFGGESFIYPEV